MLLALIDPGWATARDRQGQRRLDRANDFVRIEIATALNRGIRVVPILLGDAEMPDADMLPDDLKLLVRRHGLVLDFQRFDAEVARLVGVIRKILASPAKEPEPGLGGVPPAAAPTTVPATPAATEEAPKVRPIPAPEPAAAASPAVAEPVAAPPPAPAGPPAPAPRPRPANGPATDILPTIGILAPPVPAVPFVKRMPWPMAAAGLAGAAVIGFLMLKPGQAPEPAVAEPALQSQAKPVVQERLSAGQVFQDCAECPEMVVIPAGSFLMGSPDDEPGRFGDEGPQRRVTLASFAMGKTEVTQAQWKASMGTSPSHFSSCGDTCPVEKVNWDDAQDYIQRLNAKTGRKYTLPSESQWEYAARAGTTTAFHTGPTITTDQANFSGSDVLDGPVKGTRRASTIKVASFGANAFGLHDMHGNVGEWVQDCYDEKAYAGKAPNDGSAYEVIGCVSRVLRGGSWFNFTRHLRAAGRGGFPPGLRDYTVGFRVCRVTPIE